MTLKSLIRGWLPSTNKNFESKINRLQKEVSALLDRESQLERALQEQTKLLNSIRDEARKDRRYANAEYATFGIGLPAQPGGILIVGWYGASNCGDEIMLRTVLQRFEDSPLPVTVMLWDDYCYCADTLPNWVRTIHYPKSIWDIRSLASFYDVLLWGGGAILDDNQFNQNPDNTNTGNLFIRLSEMMIEQGKGVYAIGLSSNASFSSTEYCQRLNGIVEGCRHFSVRDPYSYATLRECGVDVTRVSLCEDIALANRNIVAQSASKEARYRVAFTPLCLKSLYAHNMHVVDLIHSSLSSLGVDHEIRLVPFYSKSDFDERYLSRMIDELGQPGWVSLGAYSPEIDKNEIVGSDLAICYRYHASLIALAYGVPMITCCYDDHPHYLNKMRHVTELFGEGGSLMMYGEFDDDCFTRKVKELFENSGDKKPSSALLEASRAWLDKLCDEVVHYAAEVC